MAEHSRFQKTPKGLTYRMQSRRLEPTQSSRLPMAQSGQSESLLESFCQSPSPFASASKSKRRSAADLQAELVTSKWWQSLRYTPRLLDYVFADAESSLFAIPASRTVNMYLDPALSHPPRLNGHRNGHHELYVSQAAWSCDCWKSVRTPHKGRCLACMCSSPSHIVCGGHDNIGLRRTVAGQ